MLTLKKIVALLGIVVVLFSFALPLGITDDGARSVERSESYELLATLGGLFVLIYMASTLRIFYDRLRNKETETDSYWFVLFVYIFMQAIAYSMYGRLSIGVKFSDIDSFFASGLFTLVPIFVFIDSIPFKRSKNTLP